jgi:hypothetical protein
MSKTIEQCQKAISQAVSRAYDVRLDPEEIPTTHIARDVRAFVAKTAGKPHPDLKIVDVAALALSRAEKSRGDEALAATIADLIDGGIGLERRALAPRNLDELMTRHRAERARTNPLPGDLKLKAREGAPRVIRRSGQSAFRAPEPPKKEVRISVGSRVCYRRLDDGTEHVVVVGTPKPGDSDDSVRKVPPGSPLGLAMRGATTGTIISVILAGNPVELEIIAVDAGS